MLRALIVELLVDLFNFEELRRENHVLIITAFGITEHKDFETVIDWRNANRNKNNLEIFISCLDEG